MGGMSIEVRGADELIVKLPGQIDTRRVLAAGASEYKRLWKNHFKALDAKGNANGWPSRHFWISEGAMKTGVAELDARHATVTCDSRAVAFQAFGGTIKPRSAKALAIPVSAAAYAAGRPSVSGLPLSFIPMRRGKMVGILVEARATRIAYGKKGVVNKGENTETAGTLHYVLFSEITKTAGMGAGIAPESAAAQNSVALTMYAAVQRQIDRKAQAGT